VLLAQGIIVVYRGSGIINFAQGVRDGGRVLFLELATTRRGRAVPAVLGAALVTGGSVCSCTSA
jgi:hypothetical protein